MKNNYKFIIMLIAIIFVAVGFLAFQEIPEEKSTQPDSMPNVVTQAEKKTLPSGFDQEKWQKEHDKRMAQHEQFWLSFLADREIKPLNTKPTYTEAYRDYVYYEGCHQIINNILNNMEPFYFVLSRNQSFNDLALNQQQALEERLSKCIQLSDFGQRSYDAGFAQQSLKQRYEAIPPKTDKEQQLAATLKLLKDFTDNQNRLFNVQRGEIIDHQLHLDLTAQRRALQNQIPKPATIFGGYNEADQLIVDELRSQIADIDQQILDNKYIDEAQVDQYKTEVERLKSALQIMLVETTSSDAYLTLYDLIKVDNQDINTDSLKAQLTGGVELIPQAYKVYLTPILVHFRACELSHPCGQESLLVEQQCLNFRNEKAPQACGGDLIDFYLNHYLSPNQLFDVEYVLSEGYSS